MRKKEERDFAKFIELFVKLDNVERMGVTKVLGIKLLNEEGKPLSGLQIADAVTTVFPKMKRRKRKELLEVMEMAVKDGTENN